MENEFPYKVGTEVRVETLLTRSCTGKVEEVIRAFANPIIKVRLAESSMTSLVMFFRIMKDGRAIEVRSRSCGSPKFVAVGDCGAILRRAE